MWAGANCNGDDGRAATSLDNSTILSSAAVSLVVATTSIILNIIRHMMLKNIKYESLKRPYAGHPQPPLADAALPLIVSLLPANKYVPRGQWAVPLAIEAGSHPHPDYGWGRRGGQHCPRHTVIGHGIWYISRLWRVLLKARRWSKR